MKSAELARLLPGVYRRTLPREGAEREASGAGTAMGVGGDGGTGTDRDRPSPLAAVLAVMEGLHAPCEAVLADLDRYFDPRRAPDDFVPFLARWLDLDRYMPQRAHPGAEPLPAGTGRLRELVAEAAELSRWRGTTRGLVRFLEVATGVPGFTVDEAVPGGDGRRRPFHVRIQVPAAAAPQQRLVRRIVEGEKPAYVTWEMAIAAPDPESPEPETPKPPRTPKKGRGKSTAPEAPEGRDGEDSPESDELREAEESIPDAPAVAVDRVEERES